MPSWSSLTRSHNLCPRTGQFPLALALLPSRPRRRAWAESGNRRQRPAVTSKNGPGDDRNRSARSRRESAVLTNRPAEKSSASRRFVRGGVAIVASAMTLTSVYAGGVGNMSCVGGPGSVNCVGQWGPRGDPKCQGRATGSRQRERAQAAACEHKWLAQCQPVVRRDPYGVARYQYAARGCEYGIGAD